MNTSDFVISANKKHNGKYDYSQSVYINARTKIKIICPKHNEFSQRSSAHLCGQGCPKCALLSTKRYHKDQSYWISLARQIHGDEYDYSKTKYKNANSKVIIICHIHGEFEQRASAHTSGKQGCPKCALDKSYSKVFIEKAKLIHGDKYDYSKTKYTGCRKNTTILCMKHGEFEQTPVSHLNGHGCQQCACENIKSAITSNMEEFVLKAKTIHGDKYDYSRTEYGHSKEEVVIICSKHGEFKQKPNYHLCGNGCPKCAGTNLQNEICEFIKQHIDVIYNDNKQIKPYELDIFIPSKNLAIEVNGLYWHSYDKPETNAEKYRHLIKYNKCKEKGISLFQIIESDWYNKKDIIKSMILNKIGKSQRIFARQCSINTPTKLEYSEFMAKNHIQGTKNASYIIGLKKDHDWIIMMSFNKHHKHEWEITRLATSLNHQVIGGASRLFTRFLNNRKPKSIISYANKFYSNGNIYFKLGFVLDGETHPNYYYIKRDKIYSRQQFQKHKLIHKLEFYDKSLTEHENMFKNGYRRFWDAGNYRFIYFSK